MKNDKESPKPLNPAQTLTLNLSDLAGQIEAACLLECAAAKAGNVHPNASFADSCFADFVLSANTVSPILAKLRDGPNGSPISVGAAILASVRATQTAVGMNTNLGILLLLAPLVAVSGEVKLANGIAGVLQNLTLDDAQNLFEAILVASPGGLGKSDQHDVTERPQITIHEAMNVARERDLIARQYVTDFDLVLNSGREIFLNAVSTGQNWSTAIQTTQLEIMSRFPDSLIVRKCGNKIGKSSQEFARRVLNSGWPASSGQNCYREFDSWLRADAHRRNPGTTADLLAAILFAVIRDGDWLPPQELNFETSL